MPKEKPKNTETHRLGTKPKAASGTKKAKKAQSFYA